MTSEFRIELTGETAVLARMAELQQAMTHPGPAFQEAADVLVARAEDRLDDTKTDPAGHPWQRWAPATAKRRAKQGYSQPDNLLKITGLMRGSLSGAGDDQGLVLGLGRDYAPFIETGTRKMPRRGILLGEINPPELADADRDLVLDILGEFLMGEASHG